MTQNLQCEKVSKWLWFRFMFKIMLQNALDNSCTHVLKWSWTVKSGLDDQVDSSKSVLESGEIFDSKKLSSLDGLDALPESEIDKK